MKLAPTSLLAALVLSALSTAANAADIAVKSAWIRGTVPAQTMSGAFMEITSQAGATLVGVSTPAAEDAEVHEMRLEGGVMKMRAAPRLELPAGKVVTLKPGGYHVMLMGLKQPLKAGANVPLTLKIENRNKKIETVVVKAEVRDLAEAAPASGHDHMHMH